MKWKLSIYGAYGDNYQCYCPGVLVSFLYRIPQTGHVEAGITINVQAGGKT